MNPITDFNAREFLTFYAVFILAVWMLKAWFSWSSDRTLDETWTPPLTANAYDVAYLRGGANELTRVAVVGLAERGFLETRDKTIGQAPNHPNPATLSALERSVFDFFKPERTVREIEEAGLRVRVNAHVLAFEERLQAEKLLTPPNVIATALRGAGLAAGAIFVVAAPFLTFDSLCPTGTALLEYPRPGNKEDRAKLSSARAHVRTCSTSAAVAPTPHSG